MASYGRPLGDLLSLVKQPLSSSAELKKLIASAQQAKFICASNLRILETQRNAAREAIDFDINEVNIKIYRDRKLIEFMNSTSFNYGKFINTEMKVDSMHATIKKYRNYGMYASFIDQFNKITGSNISLTPTRNTDVHPAKVIVRSDNSYHSFRLANEVSSSLEKVSTDVNKAVRSVMKYQEDISIVKLNNTFRIYQEIKKKSNDAKVDQDNKMKEENKLKEDLPKVALSTERKLDPVQCAPLHVVSNPPPQDSYPINSYQITRSNHLRCIATLNVARKSEVFRIRHFKIQPDRGIQF